jgi:hypothetical protein
MIGRLLQGPAPDEFRGQDIAADRSGTGEAAEDMGTSAPPSTQLLLDFLNDLNWIFLDFGFAKSQDGPPLFSQHTIDLLIAAERTIKTAWTK